MISLILPTSSPSALLNMRKLHRFKAIQAIVEMGLKPVRQAQRPMTLYQGRCHCCIRATNK